MKKILIPVDFSPASVDAAHYALNLADKLQARLLLVHICALPTGAIDIPYRDKEVRDIEKKAAMDMKSLETQLSLLPGGNRVAGIITSGQFTEELIRVCETERPFIIIMTPHPDSGIRQLLVSAGWANLLHKLAFPVLIVPPGKKSGDIRHIALACGMKNIREMVPVKLIGVLLKTFNASLSVVHIDTRKKCDSDFTEESLYLQRLLRPYHPSYHFLNKMRVEEGLLSFTDKHNVDMLIMLPGKHRLLDRLIHGSHTSAMALYSHVPVLSLHEN